MLSNEYEFKKNFENLIKIMPLDQQEIMLERLKKELESAEKSLKIAESLSKEDLKNEKIYICVDGKKLDMQWGFDKFNPQEIKEFLSGTLRFQTEYHKLRVKALEESVRFNLK